MSSQNPRCIKDDGRWFWEDKPVFFPFDPHIKVCLSKCGFGWEKVALHVSEEEESDYKTI